ncbi:FmdB family transcriptional regulator [Cellulomonas sp. H30R-01]|uniref:FmdB family zinc ribbon protein n=1 Tax=Cellulomonas sp. H30R-01 TaxID=2704467 RepID=UPI00138DC2C1|nr:FmdB family zinc ribbon protein [Cellulomonas sp. H30R-01]QHT54703.1 FmdB family transcriptional regulator [Cellulomonas sp. H30R-01]
MPTYAYACTACGHAFEIQQSFSDASLTVCPECEGRLRKVFSAVGVVFKGSGFYRNDARSSGSKSSSTTSSSSSSTPSSSSSASGTSDSPSTSSPSTTSSTSATSKAPAASS